MKYLITLFLLLITSFSYAFAPSNAGQYAVIHTDGHVTDTVFRILQKENRWRLENKKSDGTWEDVICEYGCELDESKKEDINNYLKNTISAGVFAECINNNAFAFCSLEKRDSKEKNYLLISLLQNQPSAPVRLSRLKDDKLDEKNNGSNYHKSKFPFTAKENSDGAKFVWFIINQSGLKFDYLPAKDLPQSPQLELVSNDNRKPGNLVWWKEFVAICISETSSDANIITASGMLSLRDLEKKFGPVKYYHVKE